ncbi:hypothetical protein [Roseovarius aquimarinus]|uniref:Uncharacterized protein n=1 Tax=Roseovarius aquimarinus TaxID=1229156 RepID=A0ABW7I9C3_9RHOB
MELMFEQSNYRSSRRFRFSAAPAHKLSPETFETYLILAWRFGFLERSKYHEVNWVSGLDKSSYDLEGEVVRLTREGWEYLEENNKLLLHQWGSTLVERVPHAVTSIFTAALTTWAILYWGAP